MRRLFLSCVLFCFASVFGTSVLADERPQSTLTEEVSVTASRTPILLDETGNSITILTRDEIERRGAVYLADLLRGLPGLSVSRSGPAGSLTQIRARGAEANHVLVRIDGVDVSDAFGGDQLPFEMISSEDIERIEFVRGPQSGLWGSDAVAGVINIITRSSRQEGGSFQIEAGSFDTRRVNGRYDGGSEALSFSLSGAINDTEGTNISRQGNERDGSETNTFGGSVVWAPEGRGVVWDTRLRHTDSESEFDAIDFVTTGLPIDADNLTTTDMTLLQSRVQWDRGLERTWNHQLTFSTTTTDTETFLSGSFDSSTAIDKLGLSFQSYGRWKNDRHEQRLTFAVDHEQREFEQRGLAGIFGDPNQNQELDNTGVAVEYRFSAPKKWAATAALRHENNSDFDNIQSFRLTASRSLKQGDTRLRAAVGTGQKAPTFLERFGFFPGSFIGNPDLEPEESTSWEIGLDQKLGENGRLALTYFDAALENEINGFFFDTVAGAFTAVNLADDSDRSGIELSYDTTLGSNFDLLIAYSYIDTTEPDGVGGTQLELRRPRNSARVNLGWRGDERRWSGWLGLDQNGSQDDLFFPPFPQPSQRVDIDEYLLADLNVQWKASDRWTVTGRVDNLLDEEYENVFGFRNSGVAGYLGLQYRAGAR